jgi:hypothetical protein
MPALHTSRSTTATIVGVMLLAACHRDPDDGIGFGTGGSTNDATATSGSTLASDASDDDASNGADSGRADLPKYDVGAGETDGAGTGGQRLCEVADDGDAPTPCEEQAPPDSFDPEVLWTWQGEGGSQGERVYSAVTPLVANLTDDNDDGSIDLCDVPDVVVVAYTVSNAYANSARLYVLDGATGSLHFEMPVAVAFNTTPAIADIDGDGLVEVVAIRHVEGGVGLVAFEHDGSLAWESVALEQAPELGSAAVAIGDLDNDGSPEIVAGYHVLDGAGTLIRSHPAGLFWNPRLPALADLDGDQSLEVIEGARAFLADGTLYFDHEAEIPGEVFPQVGDMDDDGEPEIVAIGQTGISLLEHDGTITLHDLYPFSATECGSLAGCTKFPAAIHDTNADGRPEIMVGSRDSVGAVQTGLFGVLEADLDLRWSVDTQDWSGSAGSTAFDFLGNARAVAIYADEVEMFALDADGAVLMSAPRLSWTAFEFPVVADVDNDGAAEIVVVSNERGLPLPDDAPPAVQVIRDSKRRWIRARRIWNQHTYHVTNVREDGTIPQHELPHWQHLNTFRTQAQIKPGGGTCMPEPEG